MKRGTITHPKMKALQEELGVDRLTAVGLIEAVFHFTANYAPQGDIGKYSDESIAEDVFWRKSPEKMISALKKTRWIDEDPKHRLVVHDWTDHAEEAVRKKLARQGLAFWNGATPTRPKKDNSRDDVETPERQNPDEGSPRARGPTPTPTPTPVPATDAHTSFETLRSRPELAWLTPDQWQQVHRNVSGHPDFKKLDWPAWTEWVAGEAVLDPKAQERKAKWLAWKLEDWLSGKAKKNATAATEKTGAIMDPEARSRLEMTRLVNAQKKGGAA